MSTADQIEWSRILDENQSSFKSLAPQYETASPSKLQPKALDAISKEQSKTQLAPGVIRKTSINISSEPVGQDSPGQCHSYAFAISGGTEKSTVRKRIVKYRDRTGRSTPRNITASLRRDLRGLEKAADLKRWDGMGRPGEAWGKLKRDPELWDHQGDTLVFFGRQHNEPSFRVHSRLLQDTDSPYLLQMLEEGRRDHLSRPQSIMSGSSLSSRARKLRALQRPVTPAMSEAATLANDVSIQYHLYFDAPRDSQQTDILRYHVTTRNFFALLLNKSIVGLTFYQAVVDLCGRLMAYLPSNIDHEGLLIEHLVVNGLVDVRNDPGAAAGLLAWSEECTVRWQDGWLEAFVHSAGMYEKMSRLKEYQDITPVTRSLLERAHLHTSVKVQEAQDRLLGFDFEYAWSHYSRQMSDAHKSFTRYAKFLKRYYEGFFRTWPPKSKHTGANWLTRYITIQLQQDFGALYDYLVDRDVTWNSRHNSMVRTSEVTSADSQIDAPMTNFFVSLDQAHSRRNIPYPYPLLPASLKSKQGNKSGLLGGLKKDRVLQKRIILEYSEANNDLESGYDSVNNDLVSASADFEKMDHVGEIDPAEARRGRWMLIYCILQTLSDISCDNPEIGYTEGVDYFLNARLEGTPPWRPSIDPIYKEAGQEDSYCWKDSSVWSSRQVNRSFEIQLSGHRQNISLSTSSVVSKGDMVFSIEGHEKSRDDAFDLRACVSNISLDSDNSTAVSISGGHHRQSTVGSTHQGISSSELIAFGQDDRRVPIRYI